MRIRRQWIWTGALAVLTSLLFISLLALRADPIGVRVVFVHQQNYPKAVFTAYVTNRTGRPILLSDAELYFQSDGQSDSITWSHWNGTFPLGGDEPLLNQSVASFSIAVSEYERQGRLTFDYTCKAGLLRKAASPPLKFLVRVLGLATPQFRHRQPRNATAWLANQGLINDRVRKFYEGPWVKWQESIRTE